MDELFTPISTTYLKAAKDRDDETLFTESKPSGHAHAQAQPVQITTPDAALDGLKAQPDYDQLISILECLCRSPGATSPFSLHTPSPTSAAIIHTLVTEIAPNYWIVLQDHSNEDDAGVHDLELFVDCLRSVAGINALVANVKALLQEIKLSARDSKRPDSKLHISIFIELLATVLHGNTAIRRVWFASTTGLHSEALRTAQSQSLLSILTSGKLLSVAAEAVSVIGHDGVKQDCRWLADGPDFSRWLGSNIVACVRSQHQEPPLLFCSSLFHRGLSLGYADNLIETLTNDLLLHQDGDPELFGNVCLSSPSQTRKVLATLLQHLSARFLDSLALQQDGSDPTIAAVAGLIHSVTKGHDSRVQELVRWCTSASGAGLGHATALRRSVIAVLAQDRDVTTDVLEKSLAQFGDGLYIRHAAILQQDVHAEILLLSAGYVSRASPVKLAMLLRSSAYLGSISNRIAATQVRARFLGMVVGEVLSSLVDSKGQKLDFKMEELDTEDAARLKALAQVKDVVGSSEALLSQDLPVVHKVQTTPQQSKPPKKKPKPALEPITSVKPRTIIEIVDDSDEEEEDDDLVPYAKGSDPEDSDDDATLVQRNKLRPPVYVRDLINYFRDSESYEKQKLALQTAPSLLRRKANYGTEVSAHADELANLMVAVQDKFEMEDFDELKLQSLVALVVSQPKTMGPWFARTFFQGDYSLSQRTTILVTLGLAARELAGYGESKRQVDAFASKRLPENIERLYLSDQTRSSTVPGSSLKTLPPTALDNVTRSLTSTFLEPLAAEAADTSLGPDALKLQTFTKRYKSSAGKKPRVRAIPNTTAAVLAGSFFSPLTAHFQVALRSAKPVVLNQVLLGVYLQTLGVIIHAAGPSTLSLPQLTSELWDLLLSVRQHVLGALSSLKGWHVAMSSLIAVNEGDMRGLCQSQGRQVVETREWVSGVFERTRGDDGGEENEVKMLAAGVLIRLGEAMEKYQALLMGDMIGF
ncbi:DNA replication checkpoint protein-like protein [Emericellopsis cladophorae]|uniref:DNA replication checkpoint protein-like protein n=1 Tax=Emericellopsis cladophorae TaxID=2686198 RepID=A0A9Q0BGV3_9HYPO|nr:DNA replication checkpoint protein-like protein [Emericellopsis cladophorae]KAI6783754.1 DNA replication checkpoint protein-like protein [Emericellopsis cladophorae]